MSALAISSCNYIRILAEPYCEGGPIRQFLTRKCHFGDVPNGPATALGSPLVRVLRRGAPRRRAPPGSMRDSRHGRFTAHRRPSHRQPSACSGSIRDYSRGHPTNFLVFEPLHQRRPLFLWGCCSLFSLSRSSQRSSILLRIRSSIASAEVLGIPAR